MEATGYYDYHLTQFLYKNKHLASMVNPICIKRFIEMKLAKVKTDFAIAKSGRTYDEAFVSVLK